MQGYVQVLSARILDLISGGAKIERIAAGFAFSEGPVWTNGYLLFNDIPNSRTVRLRELPEGTEITTFRSRSDKANGMTIDHKGRLIVCEGDSRRVSVVSEDGQATTLFDRFQGKRFNSPNDLAIKSNGDIYFTDPIYGLPPSEEKELEISGVFAADRDGTITLVTDDLKGPNGIAFSPDEKTLYVVDSADRNVVALDLNDDGTVTGSRVVIDINCPGVVTPDGMKVDQRGILYCPGPGGVWVVDPAGELLGRIVTPESPANLAWGGKDWSVLYITARTSVYRVQMLTNGVPVPYTP
jgi:sugar lactone lactonase YvrE